MKNRINFILLCLLIITLTTGCKDSHKEKLSKYGSITAHLVWKTDSPSLNVNKGPNLATIPASVITIKGEVTGTGMTPLSAKYPVAAQEGTVKNVPIGTGRLLTVFGKDNSGNVIYQGQSTAITVVAGQTTNAGEITMEPYVATCTAVCSGLVGFYPFNGNANDESGNNNHGIVTDAIATADKDGSSNSAYYFDGDHDYITLPNTTELQNIDKDSFSISVWIKQTSNQTGAIGAVGNTVNGLKYEGSIMLMNFNLKDDNVYVSSTNPLQTNQYYHIVGVVNVTEAKTLLYINGSLFDGVIWPNANISTIPSQNWRIGINNATSITSPGSFNGNIDEVRMYNRALSAAEIQTLYDSSGFTLTLNKSGNGTVDSSADGIACGADCDEVYPSGTSVTLVASPDSGYELSSWSGCTSTAGRSCTVDLTADVTVTANFVVFPAAEANYVSIPGGTFQMGDIQGGGNADQSPVHTVTLYPFYIMEREVTAGEYKTCTDATSSCIYGGSTATYHTYDNSKDSYPINYVSWNDVQTYVVWKNTVSSRTLSLCTEAQWEYAARAGTSTKWSCGNDEACLSSVAWTTNNNGAEPGPKTVKTKAANPWGLYDMHGNMMEYVQDYYSSLYYSSSPELNPTGPASGGTIRAYRGGSYSHVAAASTSAYRAGTSTSNRTQDYFGFRLCAVP